MTVGRRILLVLLICQVSLAPALALLPRNPEAGEPQATHVVQAGETLAQIAQQYYVTVRQLQYANFITDAQAIAVGQEVAIPQANLRVPWRWEQDLAAGRLPGAPYRVHTVTRGETLATIARSYGFRTEQLLRVNDLADPNRLEIGQTLHIPHGGIDGVPPRRPAEKAPAPAVAAGDRAAEVAEPVTVRKPEPEPEPEEPGDRVHVVAAGETLEQLAARYYVSTRQLRFYNLLPDGQDIGDGDRLRIPPPDLRVPWQWQRELAAGRLPARGERTHTVARGETLVIIARRYGLSSEQLQAYNRIPDPDQLKVGEQLRIPAGAKLPPTPPAPRLPGKARRQGATGVYVVVAGDTLSLIAKRYGIKVEQLQYLNRIDDPNLIAVGDRLLIPDGALKVPPPPASKYTFMWPLQNFTVVSEFGRRGHGDHRGLDMAAPRGTPIRAAADGTVVFAGSQRGHGHVVILQHDDRTRTLYSHNRENLVRKGQKVVQGQIVATVGKSGNARGYHVHFEFFRDEVQVDPRSQVETQLRR